MMKLFSNRKPVRKHNEWFISGNVRTIVRKDRGTELEVTHMIEVRTGKKMMHHIVWVNQLLWEEVSDTLEVGIDVCIAGEVRYGRNGLPCYNRATAIQIL